MINRPMRQAPFLYSALLASGLLAASCPAFAGESEYSMEPQAPPHFEQEVRIYQEHKEQQLEMQAEREEKRCEQFAGYPQDVCEDRVEEKYGD